MSTLTYCHQVWNFCTKSNRTKLERIQERVLRIVFKDKSATYDELLKKAGLTTLYNLRLQDLAILMYKVKHKLTPIYIQNMFEENSTIYQLRNESDFKIPRFRTVTYGKHSIRYMGPYLWSRLSRDEKNSDTLHSFISTIRRRDIASLLGDNCENCPLCLSWPDFHIYVLIF